MAQIAEKNIPTEIVPVEAVRAIERERNGTINLANANLVKDHASAEKSVELCRKLTFMKKFIINKFKPILQKQRAATDATRALQTEMLQPVIDALETQDQRAKEWRAEQYRKERAEAEARRQREQEAEEARQKEIATREKQRAAAEARGCEVGTDAIEDRVPEVESEPKPVQFKDIDPTPIHTRWEVRVVDKAQVPDTYKTVNLAPIRKLMFAAERDDQDKPIFDMPGIEVYPKPVSRYG